MSPKELLPCECGSRTFRWAIVPEGWQVKCAKCGKVGPDKGGPVAAKIAWNLSREEFEEVVSKELTPSQSLSLVEIAVVVAIPVILLLAGIMWIAFIQWAMEVPI